MEALYIAFVFAAIIMIMRAYLMVIDFKKSRKIFIICPVRNVGSVTKKAIHDYVLKLEKEGAKVHWPSRDTKQDTSGTDICSQNREAIFGADEVHIWIDLKSQGSLFDVGMTFAYLLNMSKKFVIINRDDFTPTEGKSFQNVILDLEKTTK